MSLLEDIEDRDLEPIDPDLLGVPTLVKVDLGSTKPVEVKNIDFIDPTNSERIVYPPNVGIKESIEQMSNITNKLNAYKDLSSLHESILTTRTICKADAINIDSVLEGKLSNRVSLEEYTNMPTITNYIFTTKFTKVALELMSDDIVKEVRVLLDKDLAACKVLLNYITDNHYGLNELANDVRNDNYDFTQAIDGNKNLVVPGKDGEFCNLIKTDITKIAIGDSNIAITIQPLVNSLVDVFSCPKFRHYFWCCIKGEEYHSHDISKYSDIPLTIGDIVKAVSTTCLQNASDVLYSKAQDLDKTLAKMEEIGNNVDVDTITYIDENRDSILDTIHRAGSMYSKRNRLVILLYYSDKLLDALKTL
jgi:hypothetical protein